MWIIGDCLIVLQHPVQYQVIRDHAVNQCYHVLPVFKELQRPGTNILGRPAAGVRNLASLRCGLRCLHTKGKQVDTVLQ